MAVELKIKKWGNSMGVILPMELIKKKRLEENDTVIVEIVKEADLTKLFGNLRSKKKISGQEFKNMVREGWEK